MTFSVLPLQFQGYRPAEMRDHPASPVMASPCPRVARGSNLACPGKTESTGKAGHTDKYE